MRFASIFLCLLLTSAVFAQQAASDLQSLYRRHSWFELRDSVARIGGPAFYRGAVECAFSQLSKCEADLHGVVESHSSVADAIEAHRILVSAYFRTGMYRAALSEADALLSLDPNDPDMKSDRPLLALLGQSADQAAQTTGDAVLKIQEHGLPVEINGKSATYWFDTGANLSVVSDSEARRLGLLTRAVETKAGVMTGAKIQFRVAIAGDVQIGNSHLRNVAFLIFSDDQQPFGSLPQDSRGLLGMPVLLALGRVSFGRDRRFEITMAKDIETSTTHPNLCFDGKNPVAEVEYADRAISFTLDTGATRTDLYPPFAAAFPELMRGGKKHQSKMEGLGSTEELTSVILPTVKLKIDHFLADDRPANVLLEENGESSKFFFGNLGIDLLMQPRMTTLDFRSMRLSVHANK